MAWRRSLLWLGALAFPIAGIVPALPAQLAAQVATPGEYQLKAVFLFNFAQFVEWPPEVFSTPNAPLVIGILGEDPFGEYLDEAVRNEVVESHPLTVRRFRRIEEITSCHILFVSRSELGQLERVLESLKGRSILTVGDFETFARRGGMIRFAMEDNRIKLRINLAAAESAKLKLSSKLLRPAQIVTTGRD